MRNDDLNLIQMEIDRQSPQQEGAPSSLAHQFESLAAASRALESSLARERVYSKQLREYANQLITRMHFLQRQEKDLTERAKELENGAKISGNKVQELTGELQRARNELHRYRGAWSQVLAREKHAQYVLSKGDESIRRIQELELAISVFERRVEAEKQARERAENQLTSQRQELQSALVRVHSSEARYGDMARELEAMHTIRKNHALELSRVEQSAREKLEIEFSREREKLSKELSLEREELARQRTELERVRVEGEQAKERLRRELSEKYAAELQRSKAQSDAEEGLKAEISKMDSLARALGDESKKLRQELSEARTEVALVEESSRQAQLELLRSKEEISSLQKVVQEERRRNAALEQAIQASENDRKEMARLRDLSAHATQECCELIQKDRRQTQRLIERLIDAWGQEDPALREALDALRDACEIRSVRSEVSPAKLEIVTASSKFNC